MRIISQDGCFDIPYEQVVIQRYHEKIYFLNKNLTGVEDIISDTVIAEYSTEEKAIKAMEICRELYKQSLFNKGMIPEAADNLVGLPLETADKIKDQISGTFIFEFPEDEEV